MSFNFIIFGNIQVIIIHGNVHFMKNPNDDSAIRNFKVTNRKKEIVIRNIVRL
jgi:hypothetical protein